jgi:hypothetical protein
LCGHHADGGSVNVLRASVIRPSATRYRLRFRVAVVDVTGRDDVVEALRAPLGVGSEVRSHRIF